MFVVLEGGEGAGKSTLAEALAGRLRAAGREVVVTREPGGTRVGELLRGLLHEPLSPWAETFAFLTARAQLVAEVIRPALERGAVVLCDRFAPSTFAYQGYARGLDLGELRTANAIATGGLQPDLVLYLDLPPEVGLPRKHGESEAIRTGLEGLAFHRAVREGYHALAKAAPPGAWVTIDATRPPAEVAAEAWDAVNRHRI
ncbi:MAG: dTMP kinase [Hyphomicrobiales bacterium]